MEQGFGHPTLNGWEVNLYNAVGIFHKAQAFNQPLTDWNLKNLIITDEIWDEEEGGYGNENSFSFAYSGINCVNYSLTLRAWADNPETSHRPIILLADAVKYSPDIHDARETLENEFNWTIQGDSEGGCSLSTENFTPAAVEVYPNPVKDVLYINGLSGNEKFWLHDVHGKLITDYASSSNDFLGFIDMEFLPQGIYFLTIEMEPGKKLSKKIIKRF